MMMAVLYMVMNDYPPRQILTEIGRSSHTHTSDMVALLGEVAGLWTDALYNEEKGTWKYLQIDEFTCGARKYHRGKRVRARGIDWFMSLVRINIATNKVDRWSSPVHVHRPQQPARCPTPTSNTWAGICCGANPDWALA